MNFATGKSLFLMFYFKHLFFMWLAIQILLDFFLNKIKSNVDLNIFSPPKITKLTMGYLVGGLLETRFVSN